MDIRKEISDSRYLSTKVKLVASEMSQKEERNRKGIKAEKWNFQKGDRQKRDTKNGITDRDSGCVLCSENILTTFCRGMMHEKNL